MLPLRYAYISTEPPEKEGDPTIFVLVVSGRRIAYTTDKARAEADLRAFLQKQQTERRLDNPPSSC